ncbi:hypothetical protein KSP40_PGU007770 [Platanthera guangdongensis]|uniref:Secreted protein n=1 Tax=Platanthera guangdongensis TaxID=2320717 RepID=A0ABR2MBX0_9ASPA
MAYSLSHLWIRQFLFVYLFHFFYLVSNNILYPKEDKERKILLYACESFCIEKQSMQIEAVRHNFTTFIMPVSII